LAEPLPLPLSSGDLTSVAGLMMTLINPFTILFWASVSTQVASLAMQDHALALTALGVILGTLSWITVFNSMLHMTRHRISSTVRKVLNYLAGLVLLGFAGYSFMHGFWLLRG